MGQEGKVYFHCVRKHVMVHENLFVQEFSAQIVIVLTGRPDVWTGPSGFVFFIHYPRLSPNSFHAGLRTP